MVLVPQITGCFQITFLIEVKDFVDTSVNISKFISLSSIIILAYKYINNIKVFCEDVVKPNFL